MRSPRVLVLLVAILAGGVGFLAYRMTFTERLLTEATAELMRLKLPDTSGKEQPLAQWRDKVLVVNFWATWCEPCRDEIPILVRAQARHALNGVQIVGISIDSVAKVRQFAIDYRIEYPLVIGSMEAFDLTRKLGNKATALPYTVVLSRAGTVAKAHLGGISETELESAIKLASN